MMLELIKYRLLMTINYISACVTSLEALYRNGLYRGA